MLKNKLENAPRLFRYVLSVTDMIDAAKAYELEMPEYIGWTVSEIELMRLKKEIEAMDGPEFEVSEDTVLINLSSGTTIGLTMPKVNVLSN